MIVDSSSPKVLISGSDLLRCASIVEARFEEPAQEAARIEAAHRLLRAAFSLEAALRIQARCALVNHCGTHGTSNLADTSTALFDALSTYACSVRETARYCDYTAGPVAPTETRLALEVA